MNLYLLGMKLSLCVYRTKDLIFTLKSIGLASFDPQMVL